LIGQFSDAHGILLEDRQDDLLRMQRHSDCTLRDDAGWNENDLLGKLERSGYVERHPHPDDRRARIVHLTESGQSLQRTAHETSRDVESEWAEVLGEHRLAALRSTLEEMIAHEPPG
jgi:hypothetical protein